MNLSAAAALSLVLISVSAAHLINTYSIPVSQVRWPLWNSKAGVLRPPWKSNIQHLSQTVRPRTQSLPRQLRRSQQSVRAKMSIPKRAPRRRAGSVKLTNYKDKVYHLPIEIGTPGQQFNMALYTSYTAMWVKSLNCSSSHPHRRYNSTFSRTYVANGEEFGQYFETNRGFWSQDDVTVAGLAVRNQSFGELVVADDTFKDMDIDGVFGLVPTGAGGDEGPTVFENMISQLRVPISAFSLYLNRVEIINVNQYICDERSWVELDTSTPLIQGPLEEIRMLHYWLGGEMHEKLLGRFVFDCSKVDSLPDVGFTVSGHMLRLSSRDYVIKEDEDGQVTCFSAFAGFYWRNDNLPVWFFGSSFMRAYYTYFDKGNRRIGFAKAKH
ncbi:cathepsin d [Plakobranchus ocellatus]|uniref:Cathepsin d n=1 Tax=Plakobranchus ocellatus TaxID=259542 RepID=A0AAV4C0D9_9GAST|nr:cathepsin d [Plakobranchus ocellatus]